MSKTQETAVKKYGAAFKKGEQIGERLYDAIGLRAAVGTDAETAVNDFDNIMPWAAMRRCNTEIIDGKRVPAAFEGEAGYDNVNKDVFVYVPLFFYQRKPDDTECTVCMDKLEGFDAPVKFKNADGTLRDFVFLPAYTAGLVNGVVASRSGLEPFITNLNGWIELTRGAGDICIESTMDDEIKNVLLDIEFATREVKTIMAGAINADHAWKSGATDDVKASSGSPLDNTSGRYPCKYRGIENPWGNQFRFRWDVLIKDRVPYIIDDPKKYSGGEVTDDYKALSYMIADDDGWANEMGVDESFPNVSLPIGVTGRHSNSSYGCYFWQWANGTYALRVGGHVYSGRTAGARYCDVYTSPSYAYWCVGAALSPA